MTTRREGLSWLRIGVDVGGTNTDAAIIGKRDGANDAEVLGWGKTLTTSPDPMDGIFTAIKQALASAHLGI